MMCPRCASLNTKIGWNTITTDLLPWADEDGAIHQHAHGWLTINWGCLDCHYDWTTREEHILRCWCGWIGVLTTDIEGRTRG